jgi:hypothetical protein
LGCPKVELGDNPSKSKGKMSFSHLPKALTTQTMGLSEKKLVDSPMHLLTCRRHQILFFMQFLARWRAKNCELRE